MQGSIVNAVGQFAFQIGALGVMSVNEISSYLDKRYGIEFNVSGCGTGQQDASCLMQSLYCFTELQDQGPVQDDPIHLLTAE